ncbi:Hypothetical predicted protein [Olea europaea subsp. europaea]|uniref:Uncharacterized protein n=1 Tax=Olea europaea subsp. europaea TaxID=158383 RepID=A0A8S0U6S6_OLEEU|nr:Hypothetical predicted protein [Olea europaea subsp. europaea]
MEMEVDGCGMTSVGAVKMTGGWVPRIEATVAGWFNFWVTVTVSGGHVLSLKKAAGVIVGFACGRYGSGFYLSFGGNS